MKKRNGFTLIELLAVIIVLAIIALIAMPIIFNVIENAKIKAMENSTYGLIDAVRMNYMEELLNDEDGTLTLNGRVDALTVSGEHPTGGYWFIDNAEASTSRGIAVVDVTFASMAGYVCKNATATGLKTYASDTTVNSVNYKAGDIKAAGTISAIQAKVTCEKTNTLQATAE